MKALRSLLLVLLCCSSALAQPVLRQLFTTNPPPQLSSINGPIVTTNGASIPQLTFNGGGITNVEMIYDTAANIDSSALFAGLPAFAYDANRFTIGDGVTLGGIVAGVRYWPSPTNALLANSRPGELAVSAVGNAAVGPTFWINAGLGAGTGTASNGTNWVPVIEVRGNSLYTNPFDPPYVAAISIEYGATGISDSGGTGGAQSFINSSTISAGSGGNATNNGTAGSGSDSGGFTVSGGNGGNATGAGSVGGSGGGGGAFQMVGGNGGNATHGFTAGNGGLVGNFITSGGTGGDDTASGNGGNGGAGGIVTSKGGNAEVSASGVSIAGGAGGTITSAAVGTNAGGNISAVAVFHKRPGGSMSSYLSTFVPATVASSTSTAGPSSATGPTSLLGTAQFATSPSAQTRGWTIPSNTVDHVGRTLRFKLSGYIATSLTPTLEVILTLGGTTVIDTGAQTLVAITGNQTWTFSGEVTCRTTGAAATWIGQGVFEYFSAATTMNAFSTANTGTTTVSTLVDKAIDVQATFSANNTIQCTSAIFEMVN